MDRRKKIRRIILIFWLLLLATFWGYYIYNPEAFNKENTSFFLAKFGDYLIITYTLISILRPFTLIPGTTFVIAMTGLFPDKLILVFIASLIGIIVSATLIYFFSEYMGFADFFKRKYPKKIKYLTEKMNSKYGLGFVILWSIVPVAPSDLIFYAAGSINMAYKRFIMAAIIGHALFFSAIIFFSDNFFNLIFR